MKLRGLIISMAVLAVLLGTLYWSNRHKPEETAKASADAPPKILSLSQADISKIDLKPKSGDEVVLAKNGSGKWQITAPKLLGVDENAVSGMLSSLSSLSSERLVEEKANDLSQYGLASPVLEVAVTEKNSKTDKLLIGDDTPASGGVFAKLEGDPRVFTISKYTKEAVNKTSNDLRDKRLLTVDSEKISKIELASNKQEIEFGRNKDEWQIVKPKPLRADSPQVDELVSSLTDAKMDLSGSDEEAKKAATAFASGTPVATAKVTDVSGTQELQVRKNKDDYYAKSSVVEGAYKVDNTLGQAISKSLDDFRNKKLFDFDTDDPNKIEMHDGTKAYFLTRGGEDWWSGDAKKLDETTAEAVVDNIRDLSASKFVESGFSTPTIAITVISNDGKRMEKVFISKNGDNYIAKRENEPALYQLDSKAIADLQKSAADLKPAAPKK
jgi:hypothetical protein